MHCSQASPCHAHARHMPTCARGRSVRGPANPHPPLCEDGFGGTSEVRGQSLHAQSGWSSKWLRRLCGLRRPSGLRRLHGRVSAGRAGCQSEGLRPSHTPSGGHAAKTRENEVGAWAGGVVARLRACLSRGVRWDRTAFRRLRCSGIQIVALGAECNRVAILRLPHWGARDPCLTAQCLYTPGRLLSFEHYQRAHAIVPPSVRAPFADP